MSYLDLSSRLRVVNAKRCVSVMSMCPVWTYKMSATDVGIRLLAFLNTFSRKIANKSSPCYATEDNAKPFAKAEHLQADHIVSPRSLRRSRGGIAKLCETP